MHKAGVVKGALLTAAVLLAGTALASAHSTDEFKVTATVVTNCTIEVVDLAFGAYDPTSPAAKDEQTVLTYRCTKGAQGKIELNNGANYTTTRRMRDATGQFLSYELFRDSARQQRWGSGAEAQDYLVTDNQPHTKTIFGRIPPREDVSAADFADDVVATINF
jgi:spore coat protein U-like protein